MSAMTQYLLSIVQPDGPPPPPDTLNPIMAEIEAFNAALREAGAWVGTAGLAPASAARVVRAGSPDPIVTDGPFAESRENVGGFWVIAATGMEEATAWAARAAAATTLPIEVRQIAGPGLR